MLKPSDRLTIIVLGYLIRGPMGGMVWSNLQYLRGLKKLGHEVYFVEDSDEYPSCYDPSRLVRDENPSYGLRFAEDAFKKIDMDQSWAYYDYHTDTWFGPRHQDILPICKRADLVLNLCGVNPLRPWLVDIPIRVLVDEDPAFTQIHNLTDNSALQRTLQHNAFFSFGENIGTPECSIPNDGIEWYPTRQPFVTDTISPSLSNNNSHFTTVMQWQSYNKLIYNGIEYGMKADSFFPYFQLPRLCSEKLEIALGAADEETRKTLEDLGWIISNPLTITKSPESYEYYISKSKAEFSVAKHGYVITNSGWFSERSVTYLASGKPVIVQETGFSKWLDTGAGVLSFSTKEEAKKAIDSVSSNYHYHCKKAVEIAHNYFRSDEILNSLLENAYNQVTGH